MAVPHQHVVLDGLPSEELVYEVSIHYPELDLCELEVATTMRLHLVRNCFIY